MQPRPKYVPRCIFFLLVFALPLIAAVNNPPTGVWEPAGAMATVRTGATAIPLADGRILIVGGTGPDGPLATAEVYQDGAFTEAAPMGVARSDAAAVRLSDGSVLITGGTTTGGATTYTAEIYDPSANRWTRAGDMAVARAGHTATVLRNHTVLIAGGETAQDDVVDTLELYDMKTQKFSRVSAVMSSPRQHHAAVTLRDGRVLLIGGDDGEDALASIDIFDAKAQKISEGPDLGVARTRLTATLLITGDVLIAGGSDGKKDLSSAELFNAQTEDMGRTKGDLLTARSGHGAFVLPGNNRVLFIGGTSNGTPAQTTEVYRPWVGNFSLADRLKFWQTAFSQTGTLHERRVAPAAAVSAVASEAIVAGGDSRGTAERYRYPTLRTDRAAYGNGDTMTVSGSGWNPGDTVELRITEAPATHDAQSLNAVADDKGSFSASIPVQQHTGHAILTVLATSVHADAASAAIVDTTAAQSCSTPADCFPPGTNEGGCLQFSCQCLVPDPVTGDCSAGGVPTGTCQEFGGNQNCPAFSCERCNPQNSTCQTVIACSPDQAASPQCPHTVCVNNVCAGSTIPCSSETDCPREACSGGTCVASNAGSACSDSNACTQNDVCTSSGKCQGQPLNCDDGDVCTADSCDVNGGCTHSPIAGCCTSDAQCGDADACTADTCNLSTHTCQHAPIAGCCNTDAQCADSNACTSDVCNQSTHQCQHTPIANCCTTNSDCNDSNACTNDVCSIPTGSNTGTCTHSAVTCPTCQTCNSTLGCTPVANGTQCSNGTCDVGETCQSGTCTNSCGAPPNQNTCSASKFTGGGQFNNTDAAYGNSDKWSFGFNAKGAVGVSPPSASGHFNALDHATKQHIDGDVIAITCFNGTDTMTFQVKTKEGCTYDVTVHDGGEPGRGVDSIHIVRESSNPSYCAPGGGGPLSDGNIQSHPTH